MEIGRSISIVLPVFQTIPVNWLIDQSINDHLYESNDRDDRDDGGPTACRCTTSYLFCGTNSQRQRHMVIFLLRKHAKHTIRYINSDDNEIIDSRPFEISLHSCYTKKVLNHYNIKCTSVNLLKSFCDLFHYLSPATVE